MTTDFRALCAELLRGLDENRHPEVRYPGHLRLVMAAARTALADEPAPVVTDNELDDMANEAGLDLAWRPELRRFARFVLARTAAAVLQPIPVSKELPWELDCLDEGWAWFFSPRVGWRQAVLPVSAAYTHWLPAWALPLPEEQGR